MPDVTSVYAKLLQSRVFMPLDSHMGQNMWLQVPENARKSIDELIAVACDSSHRWWGTATKILWDRLAGPVTQKHQHTFPQVNEAITINQEARAREIVPLPGQPGAPLPPVLEPSPNTPHSNGNGAGSGHANGNGHSG